MTLNLLGPQNIKSGYVFLNGVKMNDETNDGHFPWSRQAWNILRKRKESYGKTVTDVQIGEPDSDNRFSASSCEVYGQLIDEICASVPDEEGLQSLKFYDLIEAHIEI